MINVHNARWLVRGVEYASRHDKGPARIKIHVGRIEGFHKMEVYLASGLDKHETQPAVATQAETSGLSVKSRPNSILYETPIVTRNDGKSLWVVRAADRNHKRSHRQLLWAATQSSAIKRAREMDWPQWCSRKTISARYCNPATDELFAYARNSGYLVQID